MSKINGSPFSIIGGVIHPFNYSASKTPFEAWIDSISVRFPGQCKSVSTVIQESSCNSLVSSIQDKTLKDSKATNIFPNPARNVVKVFLNSEKHQFAEAAIYTLSGKKVKTFYLGYIPKGSFTLKSSVSELNKGTYVIKISKDETIESLILLKE